MAMRCLFPLLVASAVSLTGCQRTEDPAVLAERTKYLLTEEPTGALGVTEVHEQLATAGLSAQPVVLVGRIGTNTDATWDPQQAAFVVIDPVAELPVHDHGDGHDHSNCKFCQAQQEAAADATALVKVVDSQGQTVPIHARKLLAVTEGQIVVIRGTASIDGLGHLVVAANGVYPRR